MAKFLRDRHVKNLSISRARIDELFSLCYIYADRLTPQIEASDIEVRCMIRFDEKGYVVHSLEDIHQYYDQAHEVERLIFTIETRQSLDTNRKFGPYLELTLDRNYQLCFLTVSSDDRVWVEGAFSAFDEVISKCTAWYRFIRTTWVELALQMTGVAGIFLLSLIAAKALAPNITVENSFLISFIFSFLLGANVWTFLQRQLHLVIAAAYPNVHFIRTGKEHVHWIGQAIVSAAIGIIVTGITGLTADILLGASKLVFGH